MSFLTASPTEITAYSLVEEQLRLADVVTVVFNKIQVNPLKSTVMEGSAYAKENCYDLIVALGGGSVMDASKVIAFLATNDGDCWDYVHGGSGLQ